MYSTVLLSMLMLSCQSKYSCSCYPVNQNIHAHAILSIKIFMLMLSCQSKYSCSCYPVNQNIHAHAILSIKIFMLMLSCQSKYVNNVLKQDVTLPIRHYCCMYFLLSALYAKSNFCYIIFSAIWKTSRAFPCSSARLLFNPVSSQ